MFLRGARTASLLREWVKPVVQLHSFAALKRRLR
jgi:hypothetical protein